MKTESQKRLLPLALVAAVLITSGCASSGSVADTDAQESGQVVASNSSSEANPSERRCKTIRQTGSRMTERVCRTNAEWQRIEEQSRDALDRVQRDGQISGAGGD